MSKNKKTSKNKKENTNESGIQTTRLENIALRKLKDYLVKNNIKLSDISLEQIKNNYKTFGNGDRLDSELELIIANYFNMPIEIFRRKKIDHFDVPENYEGIVRGYLRVSSDKELDRQDTARQRRDLEKLGVTVFYEDYASGAKADRAEYNKMLRETKTQDTIICTEISRLSRSTQDFIKLMEFAQENKICLKAGQLVFDCRNKEIDAVTKGMITMMSVIAEIERGLISERTKSGLRNAKANGSKIGRPTISVENLPPNFIRFYPMYRDRKILKNKMTQEELARISNCGNRDTIGRYIKIAQKFEKDSGEKLEVFREKIENEKEYKIWKMQQEFDFKEN